MDNKKVLKKTTIIITVVILLIDILLYIKMKTTWSEIGNYHQYENTSLIIEGLFRYGILIWGILLIPIVWVEYFLTILLMKIYSKFENFKRLFLCLVILIAITIILVLSIKIISLIVITLVV